MHTIAALFTFCVIVAIAMLGSIALIAVIEWIRGRNEYPQCHVYATETDWFVAESEDHARELCQSFYGCKSCDDDGECGGYNDFECLPDAKALTIEEVDEPGRPKTTRTCGAWARCNPPGMLASTEY